MAREGRGGFSSSETVFHELLPHPGWSLSFNVRTWSVAPFAESRVTLAELSPRRSSPPVWMANWIELKVPAGPRASSGSEKLWTLPVSLASGSPEKNMIGVSSRPLFERATVTLWTFQLSSVWNMPLCSWSAMTICPISALVIGRTRAAWTLCVELLSKLPWSCPFKLMT